MKILGFKSGGEALSKYLGHEFVSRCSIWVERLFPESLLGSRGRGGCSPLNPSKRVKSPSSGGTTKMSNQKPPFCPSSCWRAGWGRNSNPVSLSLCFICRQSKARESKTYLPICKGVFNSFLAFIRGVPLRVRNAALCLHTLQSLAHVPGEPGNLLSRALAAPLWGGSTCGPFPGRQLPGRSAASASAALTSPGALDAVPTCQDSRKIPWRWLLLFSLFP